MDARWRAPSFTPGPKNPATDALRRAIARRRYRPAKLSRTWTVSEILYERSLPEGAVVRIRRLTPETGVPVQAVIEVDRRDSGPRGVGSGKRPPPLMTVEGETNEEVLAALLPFAEQDAAVTRLMAQRSPA